jgi:hypothetical protein
MCGCRRRPCQTPRLIIVRVTVARIVCTCLPNANYVDCSGPKRFEFDVSKQRWVGTRASEDLIDLLSDELKQLTGTLLALHSDEQPLK